jgi:peptide/nickel transport system permease protein
MPKAFWPPPMPPSHKVLCGWRVRLPTRNPAFRCLLSRLWLLLLTLVLAALVSAALIRVSPGFGMDERRFDLRFSGESIAALDAQHAAPSFLASFRDYWAGWLRGDWGFSISLNRPVRELVAERAATTLGSLATGLALAWGLALAGSLALERLHSPALDTVATLAAGGLLCLPSAVVVLLLLYFDAAPAVTLAAVLSPRLFRYARNLVAAGARAPHVLAARARGVGERSLLLRHICLPSAPEFLSLAGVSVSMAIGAAIPVEALSDSPGLGQLVWQSAMARDLPVLVHLTVLVAAAVCAANLASDACRPWVSREA